MDTVYRLSFAILGDEAGARDAAQQTFVSAWHAVYEVVGDNVEGYRMRTIID